VHTYKVSRSQNTILRKALSRKILRHDPIVAGGFATWLYMLGRQEISAVPLFDLDFGNKRFFGDIDIWFLDYNKLPELGRRGLLHSRSETKVKPCVINESVLESIGVYSRIVKSSEWANTFNFPYISNIDVQFMKDTFDSVGSLLSRFDLLNCSVAIYKGEFYVKDGLEEAFLKKKVVGGEAMWTRGFEDKLYSLLRAFKYSRRYNLEFSKELADKAIDFYMEAMEHPLTKKYIVNIEDPLYNIPLSSLYYSYGSSATTVSITSRANDDTTVVMLSDLFYLFGKLALMKSYDPVNNAFFVGSGIKYVREALDRYYFPEKYELKYIDIIMQI
jgi:hypothetical protein